MSIVKPHTVNIVDIESSLLKQLIGKANKNRIKLLEYLNRLIRLEIKYL